jgi:hypothetical protein
MRLARDAAHVLNPYAATVSAHRTGAYNPCAATDSGSRLGSNEPPVKPLHSNGFGSPRRVLQPLSCKDFSPSTVDTGSCRAPVYKAPHNHASGCWGRSVVGDGAHTAPSPRITVRAASGPLAGPRTRGATLTRVALSRDTMYRYVASRLAAHERAWHVRDAILRTSGPP